MKNIEKIKEKAPALHDAYNALVLKEKEEADPTRIELSKIDNAKKQAKEIQQLDTNDRKELIASFKARIEEFRTKMNAMPTTSEGEKVSRLVAQSNVGQVDLLISNLETADAEKSSVFDGAGKGITNFSQGTFKTISEHRGLSLAVMGTAITAGIVGFWSWMKKGTVWGAKKTWAGVSSPFRSRPNTAPQPAVYTQAQLDAAVAQARSITK